VQPIPFFENLFPAWAGVTQNQLQNQPNGSNLDCATSSANPVINYPAAPTATQAIYDMWTCFPHNETLTLRDLDLPGAAYANANVTDLNVPNSKLGPYAFYRNQFSSLYAWRNIGNSNYNGLQVTYNVHWGSNLQGQFNYTFSKSLDEASAAERAEQLVRAVADHAMTGDEHHRGIRVVPQLLRLFESIANLLLGWVARQVRVLLGEAALTQPLVAPPRLEVLYLVDDAR